MNLICLRLDRRPDVGAWLVLGVSPNIYKLKATLCGLLCLRKVCPGILVWNGMQFPLGTRLGKCVPLFSWIPGCIFRLRLVGKVRPTLGAGLRTISWTAKSRPIRSGPQRSNFLSAVPRPEWDALSAKHLNGKLRPIPKANSGTHFSKVCPSGKPVPLWTHPGTEPSTYQASHQ